MVKQKKNILDIGAIRELIISRIIKSDTTIFFYPKHGRIEVTSHDDGGTISVYPYPSAASEIKFKNSLLAARYLHAKKVIRYW